MVGGIPARRPHQGLAPHFVAALESRCTHRCRPAGGIVEHEIADAPLRFRFRVPDAGTQETAARLHVQVERGCRHGLAAFVEKTRAGPGLVGRLVVREARVAVDAEQRTAGAARVGAVVRADRQQVRLQVGDQALEGLLEVRLVVVAVIVEPLARVVARQRAQELEALVAEVAAHARETSRSRPQASSASSQACLGPGSVPARSVAISA